MATTSEISEICEQMLGFKPHRVQLNTIISYLYGTDTIMCAPTGFGKSLVVQVAHRILRELKPDTPNKVMVITPLLSLIDDCMNKINSIDGCLSVSLSSQDTSKENISNANHILTTPESLLEGRWRKDLLADDDAISPFGLVVVDECHVISAHAVREDYEGFRLTHGRLGEIRTFTDAPFLCLTATATMSTLKEVSTVTGLLNPATFIVKESKRNITYHVKRISPEFPANFNWLIDLCRDEQAGPMKILIFFQSTDRLGSAYDYVTYNIAQSPYDRDRKVFMYHRDTDPSTKSEIMSELQQESTTLKVVLCTSSFSLGLNHPGINYVIHYSPPRTIEEYVQETGRVARERNSHGHAILLMHAGCMRGRKLDLDMKQYATGEDCLRQQINAKFKYPYDEGLDKSVCCDQCNWDPALAPLVPMILSNNDPGEYDPVYDQDTDYDSNSLIDLDQLGSESP